VLRRFPDAVQRDSGAPLIRDRNKLNAWNDPGSAAHHYRAALRPGYAQVQSGDPRRRGDRPYSIFSSG
jgi:hypothetical protein